MNVLLLLLFEGVQLGDALQLPFILLPQLLHLPRVLAELLLTLLQQQLSLLELLLPIFVLLHQIQLLLQLLVQLFLDLLELSLVDRLVCERDNKAIKIVVVVVTKACFVNPSHYYYIFFVP